MGDRGNIAIEYSWPKDAPGKRIYLYSHWGGSGLPGVLQAALRRGQSRWTDESYLSRIIFCEMTRGAEMETTGFGISPYPADNEHPFLVVNPEAQRVTVEADNARTWVSNQLCGSSWTFEEFVKLDVEEAFRDY